MKKQEQYSITITLTNHEDGPLLHFNSKVDGVHTEGFAATCKMFRDLTSGVLETHFNSAQHFGQLAVKVHELTDDERIKIC